MSSLTNLTNGRNDAYNCAMAKTLNLYEAKTRLSQLVEEAAAGEEIVIAKAGVPRARLVPLRRKKRVRRPGRAQGRIWIAEDFDSPLPPDVLAGFLGGPKA
jgi:prevent-host-death family protein